MGDFNNNSFNSTIDCLSIKLDLLSHSINMEKLILSCIFIKYNIDTDQYDQSIFEIFIYTYYGEVYINVNKHKGRTFPLQIYNRYDHFAIFYKRQIHKMMIGKWKCAMYKPNSKYFLKLKDHFEKIEKSGVFGR